MDKFEKLITEAKNEIQNDFPPEGHFERFELKLNSKRKGRPNYWIGFASGIVAVLIIALIVYSYPPQHGKQFMTLGDISENYADVEFYYTSTIDQQTQKLSNLCEKYGKNNQSLQLIIKELEEYDNTYEQICNELNTAPGDERVINALITYYKTKLDIINKILDEIESKQIQINNHENTSI